MVAEQFSLSISAANWRPTSVNLLFSSNVNLADCRYHQDGRPTRRREKIFQTLSRLIIPRYKSYLEQEESAPLEARRACFHINIGLINVPAKALWMENIRMGRMAHGDCMLMAAQHCRCIAEIKRDSNQDDSRARASASFDGNVALDPSTITAIKFRANNFGCTDEKVGALLTCPSEHPKDASRNNLRYIYIYNEVQTMS